MTELISRADVVSAVQYHVTDDDDRNTLARAIAALPAVTVGVKPIEWHQIHATPVRWVGHQVDASSPDYNLHLTADSPDVFAWGLDGEGWHGFCDTLDAAKAAAQADYEARILAALTPTPVDDSQAPDLTDPVTVHANMLRGTIAKPTVEQIIHLYGVDALAKALAPVIVREAGIEPVAAPDPAAIREAALVEALREIIVDDTWGLDHKVYMKCRSALRAIGERADG